ncbi:MAG: hypothetical protein WCC60_18420 [Ilumatobacteraceae bacterium]
MGAKNQALAREAVRQYEWQVLTSLNEAEIMEVLRAAALAAPRVSVGTGSMTLENHQRATDGFVTVWAHRALAKNVVSNFLITGRNQPDGRVLLSLQMNSYLFKKTIGGIVFNSGKLLNRFRDLVLPNLGAAGCPPATAQTLPPPPMATGFAPPPAVIPAPAAQPRWASPSC